MMRSAFWCAFHVAVLEGWHSAMFHERRRMVGVGVSGRCGARGGDGGGESGGGEGSVGGDDDDEHEHDEDQVYWVCRVIREVARAGKVMCTWRREAGDFGFPTFL